MYDFIRLQFAMGTITADKVRSYAPRWITSEQAEDIVATKEPFAT